MELKAIETTYKDRKFRSRLEARWAVFFDTLGIRWEYEKEGYDLGEAGWYLPDFWLPDWQMFVEVKGAEISENDKRKVIALADQSGYPVYVVFDFDHCHKALKLRTEVCWLEDYTEAPIVFTVPNPSGWTDLISDTVIVATEMLKFSKGDPEREPWTDRYYELEAKRARIVKEHEAKFVTPTKLQISMAVMAARQARFEHGA